MSSSGWLNTKEASQEPDVGFRAVEVQHVFGVVSLRIADTYRKVAPKPSAQLICFENERFNIREPIRRFLVCSRKLVVEAQFSVTAIAALAYDLRGTVTPPA